MSKGPFGSRDDWEFRIIERDFSCSEYDICLATAADKKWASWSCKGCKYLKESVTINRSEYSDLRGKLRRGYEL